ncbi:hypothetical protein [Soonwooa sp.]|uniref:hypothetical protein n=1 Tax=Soonwooa sp. TaxID=1938592 RepID=UPI00261F526C|nr:hypothetical protein [Soonwooa sp.]
MNTNQNVKKDCHNLEMEISKMDVVEAPQKLPLQQLSEIGDMIQNPQYTLSSMQINNLQTLWLRLKTQ